MSEQRYRSMTHSIRLRLVNWLQSILDHLSEKPMQELRGSKVHTQPALDLAEGGIAFNYAASEGQIDNAIGLSSLRYDVDEFRNMTGIDNLKPLGTDGNLASGSRNNFVNGGFGVGLVVHSHGHSPPDDGLDYFSAQRRKESTGGVS